MENQSGAASTSQDVLEEEAVAPTVDREYVALFHDEMRRMWAQRNGEYLLSRNAYIGDQWEGLGNSKPGRNRYGLTVNYLKPIADKDVQLLMGEIPAIVMKPPSPDEEGRRLAEAIEGVLYGNWELNDAHMQLLNAAWHSVVLRRGILYAFWDPERMHVRWRSIIPENFYPAYDGDEIFECVHVSRRLTRALMREYPQYAGEISSDQEGTLSYATQAMPISEVSGGITDALDLGAEFAPGNNDRPEGFSGYTTVIDYYNRDGEWLRIMGNATHYQRLELPFEGIPFIEINNSIAGDEREPINSIDQIAELNQYYNELFSQKADIISKTADPPVVDRGSGVAPAKLQTHLAGGGAVIPIRPEGGLEYLVWPAGSMPDIEGHLEETLNAMHDLSGKPRSSFGQTVTNQSGVVTNLTLTPTLQSNELRQTIWGAALSRLNTWILMLYEEKSSGQNIEFAGGRVLRRRFKGAATMEFPLKVSMPGKAISGWYRNSINWPSAIRIDDPVYLDGIMKQVQSQPQVISLFDAHEMLGYEDSEAMTDRIADEHEDPRIHPEILEQTVNSLSGLAGMNSPEAEALSDTGLSPDEEAYEQGLSEGEVFNQTARPQLPTA